MRAVFFEGPGTMTVAEAPVPQPGDGEVRLRVLYCGICGTDLAFYRTGALAGPGVVLGHEISAVVDFDPEGRWSAGTRVTPFPARGCGRCMWCLEGHPRYCLDPPLGWGGFAEYTCYPARSLIPVPEGVDDRTAAIAEPLGVALRAVALAEPKPGDVAYVSGLGSIGLLCVSGFAAAGCRVVGADPREDRRRFGAELGCEAVFDNGAEDPTGKLLTFDPHGPAIALECSGVPESLQQVIEACGFGGVVGIVGIPMAPVNLLRMTLKEQRAFAIAGPSMDSMRAALQLVQERPGTTKVVTGTVPLEDTNEAFGALVEGKGGIKVLVAPGG